MFENSYITTTKPFISAAEKMTIAKPRQNFEKFVKLSGHTFPETI
jgi:hypothetical protein